MPYSTVCPHCSATITVSPGQRFCTVCERQLPPAARPAGAAQLPLPAPTEAARQFSRYRPAGARARWAVILLAFCAGLSALALVSDLLELNLLTRMIDGYEVGDAELDANDMRQGFVGLAQLLVTIVMFVPFFMWVYRAHQNLTALGSRGLKFSPGWAVGWFFIPIANLWRPFQVMKEIWKASSPDVDLADDTSWWYASVSPLLGIWWAAWVVGQVLDRVIGQVARRADTLQDYVNLDRMMLFGDVLSFAGFALLIFVILEIDRRQETRSSHLRGVYAQLVPAAN